MAKIHKEVVSPQKRKAIEKLWGLGELSWKLKGKQKDVYKHLAEDPDDVSCVLISRRFGKSFVCCLLAIETCLKTDNAIVKYACPKQRSVTTIIKPIIREILKDCPEHLKPEWKAQDKVYLFPNGSEIQVAGTDGGNAETLRGGYAQLLICDEAGYMDDLDYVVNSIMLPTTDTTDGTLILASTPNSKDPMHEFHESFVIPLEAAGKVVKYTLYDSPMVNEEKIQKIIDRYPGGVNNLKFRCEYLVEIPRSSETSVVPEFYAKKDDIIIEDFEVPEFYDGYVAADIGFRDLTVCLFGYYDFKNAELVIMDELVMNGAVMTTDYLADNIRHKEHSLFLDEVSGESQTPYLRVMDVDLKLQNDLMRLHNIQFITTAKDNKEVAINQLRMWIHSGKIKIHKRCEHLIYHVENGQWDKSRKTFKQLKDSPGGEVRGGHADALDALIYLVRNINEGRNPFPENHGQLRGPNIFAGRKANEPSKLQELMNTIVGRKTKKKTNKN